MIASRRTIAPLLILVAVSLWLPSPARSDSPAAETRRETSGRFAAIAERMQEFVDEGRIAGAVTLVADRDGIVDLAAVGRAEIDPARPMKKDSLFAIASMTKPIAATAAMILVDEGRLSPDDPVSKYVPEFKNATLKDGGKPKREITLRDLMTHTSGLGGDQRLSGSLEETAKEIAARPLAFEPGSRWQYSPGMTVLGRVVEVAAGQPFEEFLAARIFKPLGMNDTTFEPNAEQRKRLAQLYKAGPDDNGLEPVAHWIHDPEEGRMRGPNPSAGLFSTAADLSRFYRMILNGGELDGTRILSQDAVATMTRVQSGDVATGFTPGNGWGYGWCVVREPQGVTAMLSPGTFGHGGAFGTQGWIDPDRNAIFVLLIQRSGLPNSDASDMRKEFQRLAVEALKK